MKNIGVVGLGYVGGAIVNAYNKKNISIHTFDVDLTKNPTCEYFYDFIEQVDLVYVAVPTPMTSNGECDTSIVEQVVHDVCMTHSQKIVVIKSTVPPGTTEKLQNKYTNHTILFSPEFLTEANYLDDYLNQDVMLIGKPETSSQEIAEQVLNHQIQIVDHVKFVKVVSATTAELYKYVANVFLATKVSFANEMSDIANEIGVDWSLIQTIVANDTRLGKTHWKVPGPDNRRGFGGTCFPKDISAIINYAELKGVPTPLLKAVWKRNILVDRPERDWEQMKGRAVTD
jgi:UDPglucose 6-dehydrogenase